MKISIFPKAKAHPSSKEEKNKESFMVSNPHLPETVVITDDNSLVDYITTYAWSPFIFDGFRHADNFVSCDFLVFDIDEGLTIDAADVLLQKSGYCYLILPSPSHRPDNHRFRVVMPLERTITDPEVYASTWQAGANILGVVDEQCKDIARYFFGSTKNDGFWQEGELFVPVKLVSVKQSSASSFTPSQTLMLDVPKDFDAIVETLYGKKRDKIPEAVHYFLTNAHTGIPGGWTNAINACAFSLALSEVDEHDIVAVLESLCPNGGFDKSDSYQVERAIRDGKKAV